MRGESAMVGGERCFFKSLGWGGWGAMSRMGQRRGGGEWKGERRGLGARASASLI
jgi:hypothetical protein